MANSLHYLYMLRCSDGSFYVGLTADLEIRLAQLRQGLDSSAYTFPRRPVEIVWSEAFLERDDAFSVERQIKGWSRAKKIALMEAGVDSVHKVARQYRRGKRRIR